MVFTTPNLESRNLTMETCYPLNRDCSEISMKEIMSTNPSKMRRATRNSQQGNQKYSRKGINTTITIIKRLRMQWKTLGDQILV